MLIYLLLIKAVKSLHHETCEPFCMLIYNINMKVIKVISIVTLVTILMIGLGAPLFAGAGFVLNPSSFEITIPPGETHTKKIEVLGATEYYQRFLVEEDSDWLEVNPSKGIVGPDLNDEIEITIDGSNLEVGKYRAKVDVVEVLSGEKSQVLSQVEVIVNVSNETPELITIPRSLEMQQGQLQQVFVINPMSQSINVAAFSIEPWLYISPESQIIAPGGVGIFYVRTSSVATTGGVWNSRIFINSLEESSGAQASAIVPVTVNISSGVDFNPKELTGPGPIAITNKLDRPVFIETPKGGDVEIDEDIFKLDPEEKKIINVSWTDDKNPDHLDFFIIGGKMNIHRLMIKTDTGEQYP